MSKFEKGDVIVSNDSITQAKWEVLEILPKTREDNVEWYLLERIDSLPHHLDVKHIEVHVCDRLYHRIKLK